MSTTGKEYSDMAKKAAPKSPKLKNCVKAFLIGGFICLIGQVLTFVFEKIGLNEQETKTCVSVVLIVLTAILTGIGVFDKIAKHAGAGTIVPITGFANSIVSPAMEFRFEGKILGTGAKLFTIAGPVIVYGISASVLYGIFYWIFTK